MKPRLLDLFCGAGGAAMGYHQAGFEVVGVDICDQPRYPFEFHRADAMTFPLDGFDVIHASPPCQRYSVASKAWNGRPSAHPDLVPPTREYLIGSGLPWVIENVPGAPVRPDLLLCGSMFGLPVRRHRLFETHPRLFALTPPCTHRPSDMSCQQSGRWKGRGHSMQYAHALGVPWMAWKGRRHESRQAIPPAYTEFIGELLMAHLMVPAA